MRPATGCLLAVWMIWGATEAAVAFRRLTPTAGSPAGVLRFELPKGARIHRADLFIPRSGEMTGRDEEALAPVEVVALTGAEPARALTLRPPWFDRLDATEAARAWAEGKPNGGFHVKSFPRGNLAAAHLDLTVESVAENEQSLRKVTTLAHRSGQTFIVFEEADDRSADPAPTWGDLKRRLDAMDAERQVRYRVFRHTEPLTSASLPQAEWLADVQPMSAYNVLGRSVDQLIALHRRKAIEDMDFAKQLARQDYFSKYHPDMPEMGEVPIQRLCIEDGKPLPPRMGLFVHHPTAAGKAWYAVLCVVNGEASGAQVACSGPVEETVGTGEPVLQGRPDVTVFFDYPGERRHYVQWVAPPLANLPGQYANWGIFLPRNYRNAKEKRLSIFFHDGTQRWLKPPWPHRQDTVLLSPHDAPWRSFGYGYHEALGTLKPFRNGSVRQYFGLRVDAMLAWALKEFGADAGRVSCGGSGPWGGTAALQYGLRRTGRIAYVMAEGSADPNPQLTPYEYELYGRRRSLRGEMDAVWGKAEWKLEAESGKPIWEELDLVAYVLVSGRRTTMPFLSLGAGSQHLTWKQETDLMKAYLQTHNAFMAEFFWGSSAHLHLPVAIEEGEHPFEPRSDRPLLACNPKDRGPNPDFFPKHFDTGQRGYSGGGRLNTRPRWDTEEVVDEPNRLEITTYCANRVAYAGRVTCDVAIRNTQKFRPPPGEKLQWTAPDPREPRKTVQGEATVDENGHILLKGFTFGEPGRLVIRRAAEKGGDL